MAYTTLADLAANLTLTAGTYYMDASHNANSKNITFDCSGGNIYVKMNGAVSWSNIGNVTTTGMDATHKVIFTVKDDDAHGEAIAGSSGNPSKSAYSFSSTSTALNVTMKFFELWYMNNSNWITQTGVHERIYEDFTFKNCDFSSVIVFTMTVATWEFASANCYFRRIYFDNTNTLSGTSQLFNGSNTRPSYIYVANASTSNPVIFYNAYYCTYATYDSIKIKNSGTGGGFDCGRPDQTQSFTDSCFTLALNLGTGWGTYTLNLTNCIFDATQTGNATAAILHNNGNTRTNIAIKRCIFKGFTTTAIQVGASSRAAIASCVDSVFDSNAKLIDVAAAAFAGVDYNGYYNNTSEANWTRGGNDFTATPSWENYTSRATIDATWSIYGIPNGFSNLVSGFQRTGSNTYDGLSIDETYWSPNGIKQPGGNKVNPGVNYKFSTLVKGLGTVTLPKPTVAATGTHIPAPSGAIAAITLPQVTLTNETTITHNSEASITVPQSVVSAQGTIRHTGEASIGIPQIELYAEGTKAKKLADASITLPKPTVYTDTDEKGYGYLTLPASLASGEGTIFHPAESQVTLPAIQVSADGIITHPGESSLTLPMSLVSGEGTIRHIGSASIGIPQVELYAEGSKAKKLADIALTLPQVTINAEGYKLTKYADAAITLPQVKILAFAGIWIGTGSATLPQSIISAQGWIKHFSNVYITLPIVTAYAEGSKAKKLADAAITLPQINVSLETSIQHNGTASIGIPQIDITNETSVHHFGTAAIGLPKPTVFSHTEEHAPAAITLPQSIVSGQGNIKHPGYGSFLIPIVISTGQGGVKHTALVAFNLPIPVVNSNGNIKHTGSGSKTLPMFTFWGYSASNTIEVDAQLYPLSAYKIVLFKF